MFKALLLVLAPLAMVGPSVMPANAGFNEDKIACIKPGLDFDGEISACDRQISSGRYSGNDRAVVYRNRGIKFMNRWSNSTAPSDISSALLDFTRATQINPRYAEAYASRGKAYRNKGEQDIALADLNEAIRINPNLADAYAGRGLVYGDKNDPGRAITEYSEALRLDPRNTMSLNNRGMAFRAKGDHDRAIADYSGAIRIDPNYAFAYNNRGDLYAVKGDRARALTDLNDAIRVNPRYALAFLNRGYVHGLNGDTDRAIADYSEAISLDPKGALARNNRGNVYLVKRDYSRAIADLSEAIRFDPQFTAAFTNRALAHEGAGNVASARADYKAALALPEKYSTGKWAHDNARERLAALDGGGPSASAAPVSSMPAPSTPSGVTPTIATIQIPKLELNKPVKSDAAPPTIVPPSAAKPPVTTTAAVGPVPMSPEGRRIALVIGNSSYLNVPVLTNPKRDAALVADMLKRTGFETVTVLTDLRRDALLTALREFAVQAETADWAVVYYAGHGMEVGGTNYLVPVDARIAADRDIEFEAVPLSQVLNAAERAKKLRLVILDACRNNPFANKMKRTLNVASRSASQGLAAIEPEAGTLVVYAAKDGETALDGAGANSPFATALAKNLPTPGLEVRRLFDYVRDDVMELTRRKQKPFSYGSISGRQDFYFVAAK